MANEGLIQAIIPIVDDLERSLKAGKESQDFGAFYKGVEMIAQKMMKVLESQGVKSFDTVGTPFDVLLHDALMQLPRTDVPPSTVLEEVQKGYSMHDKVIRHARVIVSAPPPDGTPEEQKD
jgi:molecular chaperone GrpE